MAEVFGVVVSALSVAGMVSKFSTSILKLHSLWDDVQDAPEDIRQRIRQLAIVKPMLEEMEAGLRGDGQRKVRDSSAAGLSMEYCRQAVDELELLAEDLQGRISRAKRSRGLVKLKVTLKKDVLQRYHERMQFSLQLLALSQQTYIIALVKNNSSEARCSQHEAGLVQITAEDGRCQHTESTIGVDESVNIQPIDRGQPKSNSLVWSRPSVFGGFTYATSDHDKNSSISVYEARVRLPWWLSNKVWDLQAHRACQGWKFSILPWITRPYDAPIFQLAENGSWTDVLDALNRNQASLRDRSPGGETLLHMAAWGDNVDVLINLIKLGLSIQEKDSGGTTALGALWVESCSAEQVVNLMRFLALTHSLEDCLSSPFQRMDFSSGGEVVGSEASTWYLMTNAAWMIPGVLQILATEFQVDRLQLPPISRFASLRWLFVDPDVILDEISLGGGWDAASLGSMLGGPDDNNLDAFAKAYFFGVQALNYWPLDPCERDFGKEPKIESWRRLARWILPAASLEVLIHPSRGNGFLDRSSPFFSGLRFLYSHFIYFEMKKREWRRRMSRAVVMWLEDVRSSGIDLDEYGAAVRKQYLENAWLKTGEWEISEDRGPRLVDLTVGPMPEDWKLHLDWDFDDEEFAGEFWETVENPPLHIPGGWVDE